MKKYIVAEFKLGGGYDFCNFVFTSIKEVREFVKRVKGKNCGVVIFRVKELMNEYIAV